MTTRENYRRRISKVRGRELVHRAARDSKENNYHIEIERELRNGVRPEIVCSFYDWLSRKNQEVQ